MEPTHAVPEHHIEGRRRAAFLFVARDGDAIEFGPAEEQALDLVGVAVVVEVDGLVGREERIELGVRQRVRVQCLSLEDHEICDVDDADAEAGAETAQHGCGDDDFEH